MHKFDPLGKNIPENGVSIGWGFHKLKKKNPGMTRTQVLHYFPNDSDYEETLCERIFRTIHSLKVVFVLHEDVKKKNYDDKLCKECLKRLKSLINETSNPKTSRKSFQEQQITKDMNAISDEYVCVPEGVRCSEPGCKETGGTFIKKGESVTDQPHFCIHHNLRVKTKEAITP